MSGTGRGDSWPAPEPVSGRAPLPRPEELPIAAQGYDPEAVRQAFDAFYRHIARLDATLRAIEAVEVFRDQAGQLRQELRALKAAGWTQQPWPPPYTSAPMRDARPQIPPALPRLALEAGFLIAVAVAVAVAGFERLTIVLVMALAWAIVGVVEWAASRERFAARAAPVSPPAPTPAADVRVVASASVPQEWVAPPAQDEEELTIVATEDAGAREPVDDADEAAQPAAAAPTAEPAPVAEAAAAPDAAEPEVAGEPVPEPDAAAETEPEPAAEPPAEPEPEPEPAAESPAEVVAPGGVVEAQAGVPGEDRAPAGPDEALPAEAPPETREAAEPDPVSDAEGVEITDDAQPEPQPRRRRFGRRRPAAEADPAVAAAVAAREPEPEPEAEAVPPPVDEDLAADVEAEVASDVEAHVSDAEAESVVVLDPRPAFDEPEPAASPPRWKFWRRGRPGDAGPAPFADPAQPRHVRVISSEPGAAAAGGAELEGDLAELLDPWERDYELSFSHDEPTDESVLAELFESPESEEADPDAAAPDADGAETVAEEPAPTPRERR